MNIFLEDNYRSIVRALLGAKKKAYGQVTQLAKALDVNTTLISQILSGKRHFTEDQAARVSEFLKMNPNEKYYFLLLVQRERAGTQELRSILDQQIHRQREEAKNLKGRVSSDLELSFAEQAIYYSSWIYSALHVAVSLVGCSDLKGLSQRLRLPEHSLMQKIQSLIQMGILTETERGYQLGSRSAYLPPDSPLVSVHHQNWRQISVEKMMLEDSRSLFFTAPFSISEKDFQVLREETTEFLKSLFQRVSQTKPEELACYRIELFRF